VVSKKIKKRLTKCPSDVIIQSQAEGSPTRGDEGKERANNYKIVTKNFFRKIEKSA
jgi:hypothetical protein